MPAALDRRVDKGLATRQRVLDTAVDLFAEHGYEATSIEFVLRTSGVSRGALYHHFATKEALFTAALESVERRVAHTVASAGAGLSDPVDALRAGCAAWLLLANDRVVRQIVLIDAPWVVGWQEWRSIDDRHSLGLMKMALAAAAAAERFPVRLVDTYAHVLLAALIEMSLLIARSPDDEAVAARSREAVDNMLSGLLGLARLRKDDGYHEHDNRLNRSRRRVAHEHHTTGRRFSSRLGIRKELARRL